MQWTWLNCAAISYNEALVWFFTDTLKKLNHYFSLSYLLLWYRTFQTQTFHITKPSTEKMDILESNVTLLSVFGVFLIFLQCFFLWIQTDFSFSWSRYLIAIPHGKKIQGFQGIAVAIAGEVYKLPSLLGFFPLSVQLLL